MAMAVIRLPGPGGHLYMYQDDSGISGAGILRGGVLHRMRRGTVVIFRRHPSATVRHGDTQTPQKTKNWVDLLKNKKEFLIHGVPSENLYLLIM
jgi:hypothetical protein